MPSPEELLRSILDHAPDFVAHVTPDGRFLFLNRFVEGLGPDDLKTRTIYDFSDPAYHAVIRATIARAVETRHQQDYETVAVGPGNRPAHYFTRVAPVATGDAVTSVVLISTDVTRLKEAERARAESEAALQHVLAATGMGTWWWDPARDEGGHDAVTGEILALPPGPTRLEVVMSRIHPDDREGVAASLRRARDTGAYFPIEHRIIRPDGSERWVSASGRVVGGRMLGGVVDVTARKQLEAQLAQSQKLESVGRLAGGIAHDFNNMLTAILSYTQLATVALPADSPIARDLAQVKKAAERSVALTSQLLAFARQQVIEPQVVDLNDVVTEVDKLLRRVLGEDIQVVTLLEARRHVKLDRNQFEQVLVNLATNARDAMPAGGRLTIRTADAGGDQVLLSVADTGVGIAAEHLPRIFEPFFTTKDQGRGTGLGLAMCYGVVAQHHGRMTVASEVGRGTTFEIHLASAAGSPAARPAPAPVAESRGTETVLVAEDEPMVRSIVVKALTRAGYRVLEAGSGAEALAVARDHAGPIDLLVTDVVMPELGGKRLAERLAARYPALGVLYMSGYTDDSVVHHGVLDEGIDFLPKPFTPEALAARVRQALDRRR